MGAAYWNEQETGWPPHLAALPTDLWRRYCRALYDPHCPQEGDGRYVWAMMEAGYKGKRDSAAVWAHHVWHDPRFQTAYAEEGKRRHRGLLAPALTSLSQIIADTKHRDCVRACQFVVQTFIPTLAALSIDHKVDVKIEQPVPEMTEAVLKRMEELARRAGVTLRPPEPKLIEGTIIDSESAS